MATEGNRLDPWVDTYASRAKVMTASEIRSLFAVASRPEVVSLAGGMPFVSALSHEIMGDTFSRIIKEKGNIALQYGSGQGEAGLREQITEVVALTKVQTHPDDVVITAGSQMAIDLIVRVFCNPNDVVFVESPSYVGALGVFRAYECDVVHVASDELGLNPTALEEAIKTAVKLGKTPKLIYTIPTFQNPSGLTQDEKRRKEILEVGKRNNILIVEDDPYNLLAFDGTVPRAIRADDADGVVYLGSFSKTIAPGMRVGWAVAPHGIREKLVLASESVMLCPSNLVQLAISDYLKNQPWLEQVKVFRELYLERRDALLDSMKLHFPAGTTWTEPQGGFYSWVTLPEGFDATAMLPRAVSALVAYVPGTGFYADQQGSRNLRLSFCYPTPERIKEGVRRLGEVIRQEIDLRNTFGVTGNLSTQNSDLTAPDVI